MVKIETKYKQKNDRLSLFRFCVVEIWLLIPVFMKTLSRNTVSGKMKFVFATDKNLNKLQQSLNRSN